MRNLSIYCFLLIAALFIFPGCEGDPGNPGVSQLPDDIMAPEVLLILPRANRNVYDRFVIEAFAVDDSSVEMVEFLIDGKEPESGDLKLTEPPYQVRWDCSALANNVTHSIQARAWDEAGRYGLSQLVTVNKQHPALKPSSDTLRSYVEVSDPYIWLFPDTLNPYTGIGVRMIPDGPCRIMNFYVKLYVYENWSGGKEMLFEIWNSANNQPDELLFVDTTCVDSIPRGFERPEGWVGYRVLGENIHVEDDFFILVTPVPGKPGDTLAVITDDGLWRNYHGVARTNSGWGSFSMGPQIQFNPYIYARVRYD